MKGIDWSSTFTADDVIDHLKPILKGKVKSKTLENVREIINMAAEDSANGKTVRLRKPDPKYKN
jgi:hypothetical protein